MATYKWLDEERRTVEETRDIKLKVDYNRLPFELEEIEKRIAHMNLLKEQKIQQMADIKAALNIKD